MSKPRHHWDEFLEQDAREQMQEMGCDPEFIEIALEEMREGHSVEVVGPGGHLSFRNPRDDGEMSVIAEL